MVIFAGMNIFADGQNIVKRGAVFDKHKKWQAINYVPRKGLLPVTEIEGKPTMFLMAACGVNIVLDILCVVVLKLGVAGAAIATVFSQVVSAGMVTVALLRQPEETRLSLKKIRFQGGLLKRILYVGVPAGLQFVTFDLANLLIQSGINSFGDVAVAAWTAYVKTDSLTWMISGAFGVSVTTCGAELRRAEI